MQTLTSPNKPSITTTMCIMHHHTPPSPQSAWLKRVTTHLTKETIQHIGQQHLVGWQEGLPSTTTAWVDWETAHELISRRYLLPSQYTGPLLSYICSKESLRHIRHSFHQRSDCALGGSICPHRTWLCESACRFAEAGLHSNTAPHTHSSHLQQPALCSSPCRDLYHQAPRSIPKECSLAQREAHKVPSNLTYLLQQPLIRNTRERQ